MSHRDWRFRLDNTCDALDRISKYVEGFVYDLWAKGTGYH